MSKNMHRHIPKFYKYPKKKCKATPTSVKAQNAKTWYQKLYTQNKGLGFKPLF